MSALPPVEFSDRCHRSSIGDSRQADGISRFSRLECLQHARFYDSAAPASCSPIMHDFVVPSPCLNGIGTRNETVFGAQWLACIDLRFGRSRQKRYRFRPSEEGRSQWLIVLRKTLSFSIPNRFIPAHSDPVYGLQPVLCKIRSWHGETIANSSGSSS